MPDEFRTRLAIKSTRGIVGRASAAAAAVAVATGAAALMLFAASSASGASVSDSALTQPIERPAEPQPPSLAALFGLPRDAEYVDRAAIGTAVSFSQTAAFFEALALLPPPPEPAPVVVAEIEAPAPVEQAAAAPSAPIERAAPAAPTERPAPAPTATPAPPPPAPAVGAGLDTSAMNAQEQALFDATNARRASQGLAALRPNGYLVGVARVRSQDMATHDYFAHQSPVTGDTAFSLMDAYGVGYGWAGENLAMNNYPSSECVGVADQALWDSPPHRENILNPHYTEMGIGLRVSADGMYYFTIVFQGPA